MPADTTAAADILELFPPGSAVDPDGELAVGGLARVNGKPAALIAVSGAAASFLCTAPRRAGLAVPSAAHGTAG